MTTKDFVLIAAVLREARAERLTLNKTIKLFGSALADTNERFDCERFIKECMK